MIYVYLCKNIKNFQEMEQNNNIYRATFPLPCRQIITPIRLLNAEKKREVVVQALWDTGSSESFIRTETAKYLGIAHTDEYKKWIGAGGEVSGHTIVTVALPGDTAYATITMAGVISSMPPGVDFIIGLDLITLGSLSLTNNDGSLQLTFRFSDRFFQLRKNAKGEVF
jgi:hypothetical protein